MRHLLRIPTDFNIEKEVEDEFECLNLDISVPAIIPTEPEIKQDVENEFQRLNMNASIPPSIPTDRKLPVLIWIYGL